MRECCLEIRASGEILIISSREHRRRRTVNERHWLKRKMRYLVSVLESSCGRTDSVCSRCGDALPKQVAGASSEEKLISWSAWTVRGQRSAGRSRGRRRVDTATLCNGPCFTG